MASVRQDVEKCTVYVFPPSEEKELEARIQREFVEMPGLRLTADQAIRMWSPGRTSVVKLLDHLVDTRFLRFDEFGRYARHHLGHEATV